MLYCSNTSVRPPRVLTRSFPSCPHHLYYAGFRAVIGLRLVWQPYPPALAYKWFLCVGAKVCLHLPSALLNLAARTLVFSYILPTAGWIRDLHSLERAPAGRTRKKAGQNASYPAFYVSAYLLPNLLFTAQNFISFFKQLLCSFRCGHLAVADLFLQLIDYL